MRAIGNGLAAGVSLGLVCGAIWTIPAPANYPQAQSSPHRLAIAEIGTVAGILLGLAASRFRRPRLATA